jgi:hypothetical protein
MELKELQVGPEAGFPFDPCMGTKETGSEESLLSLGHRGRWASPKMALKGQFPCQSLPNPPLTESCPQQNLQCFFCPGWWLSPCG